MSSPAPGSGHHHQARAAGQASSSVGTHAPQGLPQAWRRDLGAASGAGGGERQSASPAEAPAPSSPAPLSPEGEEALRAARAAGMLGRSVVRYRGFVLLPQPDLGWLVRPERSPMRVLPFRTPPISLSDVKALVDWRVDGVRLTPSRP